MFSGIALVSALELLSRPEVQEKYRKMERKKKEKILEGVEEASLSS